MSTFSHYSIGKLEQIGVFNSLRQEDILEAKKEMPGLSRRRGGLDPQGLGGGIPDDLPGLSEPLPDGDVQPRLSDRLRADQPPSRLPLRMGILPRSQRRGAVGRSSFPIGPIGSESLIIEISNIALDISMQIP
jgi:hypothetical protein